MLSPVPLVVRASGDASAAPDGSVPIALYGSGGGGGGGGTGALRYGTNEISGFDFIAFETSPVFVTGYVNTTFGEVVPGSNAAGNIYPLGSEFEVLEGTNRPIRVNARIVQTVSPFEAVNAVLDMNIAFMDTTPFGVPGLGVVVAVTGVNSSDIAITVADIVGRVVRFQF